jgi:hypothetical protein
MEKPVRSRLEPWRIEAEIKRYPSVAFNELRFKCYLMRNTSRTQNYELEL